MSVNLVNFTFQLLLAHFLSANKENSLNKSPYMNSGIQKFDILAIIFDVSTNLINANYSKIVQILHKLQDN